MVYDVDIWQVDIVELSCLIPSWSWNSNFAFQMSMPLLIAAFFAIKILGSAILLRSNGSTGLMAGVRRALSYCFEEPTDAENLRQLAYDKASTFMCEDVCVVMQVCMDMCAVG